MENVNDIFFDGHYKDIWRRIVPEQLTIKEIDFIIDFFNLGSGSRVLDLMCGYGRHSLALARKGVEVVAIDNLPSYIEEIVKIQTEEKLPLDAKVASIVNFVPEGKFDLIICMGNSLNFFDSSNLKKILGNISQHLKKEGHFLINTWSLTEIVVNDFSSKTWNTFGEMKILSDSSFKFFPTRIETETIFINGTETETKFAVDYIFSLAEMASFLDSVDLKVTNIYSIPGKKNFTLGDTRAYIISRKE